MSVLDRGSTLARATKRYLDAHASLKWHYAPAAIDLLVAVALVATRYPAKTAFVRAAEATTAITGEVGATSIVVAIAAVLGLGLAATVTAMAVVSGLCTASIAGAVTTIHDPNASTTADATANATTDSTALRGALTGIWRAKRALPVLAVLFGTLGPLVVVADRRWETLRREPGALGRLLGASPGTYAHLAVHIAATEGGGALHALRRSRHLLTDHYGDDALATPGIVPVVGSTWIVPGLLFSMLAMGGLTLLQGGGDLATDTILLLGIPLLALTLVGTVRATVIQATFRAGLYHHLTTDTTPDFVATNHDTITDAYTTTDD